MIRRRSRHIAIVFAVLASAGLRAQVPPNIVSEGVPPVPAELKARMNQYMNLRSAFFASWHPTKRSMLVLTRFGDTNQVHLVGAPGAYRQQLTFFPDRVLGAHFSPRTDKDRFLFSMDAGGAEFYQIYRFDLADGNITLLTDGKSRNESVLFNHQGTLAAYVSTRGNGRDFDLYAVDPENLSSEKRVLELRGQWVPLDWAPDDSRLLLMNEISVNESYIHLLDLPTGGFENLTPAGTEKVAYGSAVWSKDGKGFYVVSDRGSEFKRLFYYDVDAKRFTSLTDHIPWDVEEIDISASGDLLAFTATRRASSSGCCAIQSSSDPMSFTVSSRL